MYFAFYCDFIPNGSSTILVNTKTSKKSKEKNMKKNGERRKLKELVLIYIANKGQNNNNKKGQKSKGK